MHISTDTHTHIYMYIIYTFEIYEKKCIYDGSDRMINTICMNLLHYAPKLLTQREGEGEGEGQRRKKKENIFACNIIIFFISINQQK